MFQHYHHMGEAYKVADSDSNSEEEVLHHDEKKIQKGGANAQGSEEIKEHAEEEVNIEGLGVEEVLAFL